MIRRQIMEDHTGRAPARRSMIMIRRLITEDRTRGHPPGTP
jgi:hypothetical protein